MTPYRFPHNVKSCHEKQQTTVQAQILHAPGSSKTTGQICWTTMCDIPLDHNLDTHCCDNLKCHVVTILVYSSYPSTFDWLAAYHQELLQAILFIAV
jgi:hypothetical protein